MPEMYVLGYKGENINICQYFPIDYSGLLAFAY